VSLYAGLTSVVMAKAGRCRSGHVLNQVGVVTWVLILADDMQDGEAVSPYIIVVVLDAMLMASRRAAQNVGSASDLSEYTYVGLSVLRTVDFWEGRTIVTLWGHRIVSGSDESSVLEDVLFVGAT
jgi:hypothetical protein